MVLQRFVHIPALLQYEYFKRKDIVMKIRNYITIFLATVSILLLLALAGYLTYINTDDANPVKQTITDMLPDLPF